MKKRILSIILAICMALMLVPITANAMQIFVDLSVTGADTLTLEVESGDSIDNIKQIIKEEKGISPDQQILYYNETLLEDGKTLADYNVQKDSTIMLTLRTTDPEPQNNGWVEENGQKYYLKDGVKLTDWHCDIPGWEGQWLCFDRYTGALQTGWHDDIPGWEGKWFYFDPDTGVMLTDWHYNLPGKDGKWVCFDRVTGVMRTGWHANIPGWEGQWFYFDENTGVMLTDWHNDIPDYEGQWFCFNRVTGVMRTGWQDNIPGWEGKWFYFDENTGVMQTGWHYDLPGKEGQWVYLDPVTGVLQNDASATEVTSVDHIWTDTTESHGWYVVGSNVTIDRRITVSGDVHLLLTDGRTLTVNGGIQVEGANSLTIYGQAEGTGKLIATGNDFDAGIGGSSDDTVIGGTVTINGGTVTATSKNGAGIGGGSNGGSGGTITITGGTVTATSKGGAGIGGGEGFTEGNGGFGGIITISGGTVIANSDNGVGIGGDAGRRGQGGNEIFQTNNGNAVIITDSIVDKTNQGSWNGVIFEGGMGKVYGTSVTPTENFTIDSGMNLLVPEDAELTISGIIAVNNGSVYVDGTVCGLVGDLYYPLTVNGGTADKTYTYNSKSYGKAGERITLTGTNIPAGQEATWIATPAMEISDDSFTMPNEALTVIAQYKDITAPVITGLENGKTYCAAVEFEVSDNDGIESVKAGNMVLTAGTDGKFTLSAGVGTVTVVATDNTGNTAEVTVTVNNGHTYEWQDDNGQYWKKCKFCGDETAKKDIPTISINGADSVCITQDYKFSFTLPEGATDAVYGYEFENKGNSGLPAIIENNELFGIVPVMLYEPGENSFKVYAGAKTYDGFEFFAIKTVALKIEHTDAEPKDHICDICGVTLSRHTGGKATCKDKAICEYCGIEYGEVDSSNHNLENISSKDATVTETGNKEYWQCKDCKKYFSDEEGNTQIIDIEAWKTGEGRIDKLPPEIIEGKGQNITAGEKKELTFRSNAAIGDFLEVQLDGKTLDAKYYTIKEGSTVVTLKADYVATLSAGEHSIGIVSTGGTAATTFTVAKSQKPTGSNLNAGSVNHVSKTGDNSHMALWIALLFVSGILLSVMGINSKKKKHNR